MPGQEELGSLDEVLVLEDGSLFGEAMEGSNFAEAQPACAVHKRRARSRESVHTWPMWKKNAHCACSGGSPWGGNDTWGFYVEIEFAAYEEVVNVR